MNMSHIEKHALFNRNLGITFSSNQKDETVYRDSHDILKSSSSLMAGEETKKENIIFRSEG